LYPRGVLGGAFSAKERHPRALWFKARGAFPECFCRGRESILATTYGSPHPRGRQERTFRVVIRLPLCPSRLSLRPSPRALYSHAPSISVQYPRTCFLNARGVLRGAPHEHFFSMRMVFVGAGGNPVLPVYGILMNGSMKSCGGGSGSSRSTLRIGRTCSGVSSPTRPA